MEKKKKITLDVLAQLVEERIKGVEAKMATKELVQEVLALVKNVDEKMGDIQKSTASTLEVANIDLRVDALERDVRKIKEKVKI